MGVTESIPFIFLIVFFIVIVALIVGLVVMIKKSKMNKVGREENEEQGSNDLKKK